MKTLLLIAGRSRRFWPLIEKPLWPFMGQPLLTHQLERLKQGGLDDIIFVGGNHNLEEVQRLFPDVPSVEQEDLKQGMRGALLSALPTVGDEPVCIVSSNDVIEPSGYQSLFDASKKGEVGGAILAQKVERYFPGGYLEVDDAMRVSNVIEKPGEGSEPSDLVNIVAHVHNHPQKLLTALQSASSKNDDVYEVALTSLCNEMEYVAVPYEDAWNAVKFPWHILDVTERFLSDIKSETRSPESEVHSSAVIEGSVILEEGVKVMANATIVGPCYIGKGTVIGTNALVRESIIGEQCVIGYGSEIVRSNLHSHVWTHNTYLGDSVIGQNVAFGSGCVTANFRLDEGEISSVVKDDKLNTQRAKLGVVIGNNVRIGVQSGFAPGVKIGSGSFVSSATFLSKDVKENRYVHTKEGVLEERENKVKVPCRP